MMLRFVLLFVSLCVVLPAQQVEDLLLGTWNIEFLGADPQFRRDTPPRSDEDVAAIGKKVRELGVSVMAVQEISGQAVLDAVATAAGPSFRAVLGTSGAWDDGKTQQGVGFLYDNAVLDLLHAEELLQFPSELDGVSVFHRKPVTAALRHRKTGCDFRIVVVHLKAGQKDRDQQKRAAEASYLRQWLDQLLSNPNEDRDVVILGDFNCSYGDEPERIFEQGGSWQYLDHTVKAPTIVHFDTPIDQLCVMKEFRELQRNSLHVHGVTGDTERLVWRKTYSDHFPVTARLTALADDDPTASFWHGPSEQVLPTTRRKPAADGIPPVAGKAASWPPAPGSLVEMYANGRLVKGTLIQLPSERGWVVVDHGQGAIGYPMEQVAWLRAALK